MRIWIFFILIPLIASIAFVFYAPLQPEVSVFQVKKGCAIDAVMGIATILPKEEATLYALVEGKIQSLAIKPQQPWQSVEKDQILAEWDKDIVEESIRSLQKEQQLWESKQQMPSVYLVEIEGIRRELADLKRQNLSEAQMQKIDRLTQDEKRLQVMAEQERVQYAERLSALNNELKILHKQCNDMVVKSPFKGMTTAIYVNDQSWVKPGDPLMQIVSDEKWIQASFDEADVQDLVSGQMATLYFHQSPIQGRVQAIAPVADPNTRRRMVIIEADLSNPQLVSGMTGQVSIAKSERKESLLVPRRALLDQQLVIVEEGRIHFQPVQVGFRGLHYAEILSGVAEGQSIIVDNLHLYHENQRVKIGKTL